MRRSPPNCTFQEHIVKANHSIRFCVQDLRKAYSAATDLAGHGGDALYTELLLKDAVELEQKIGALVNLMEHPQ